MHRLRDVHGDGDGRIRKACSTGVPERVEHVGLDTPTAEATFYRVSAFVARADAAYRDALPASPG